MGLSFNSIEGRDFERDKIDHAAKLLDFEQKLSFASVDSSQELAKEVIDGIEAVRPGMPQI